MKKLLVVLAVMALACSAQANLLVNGSFEQGSGQVMPAWTITGDGGQLPVPAFQGYLTTTVDGSYIYGNDAGWADQTGTCVQTLLGSGTGTFTLSGSLWVADGGNVPSSITLTLLVDGAAVGSQTLSQALSYGTGWQLKTVTWTGTAVNSVAAEISHNTTGADSYVAAYGAVAADNLILDATSWTPVPEPASLLALGTGLVGLAGFIRRKK